MRSDEVCWITADEMRAVDRLTIEEFGVDLVRMMENAGRSLAELAISRFAPSSVVVLAGAGGNGGGGLVAARHLANRGVRVAVSAPADRLAPVTAEQLVAGWKAGVHLDGDLATPDLIIDALVGYGLDGGLRGRAATLVGRANAATAPILSLDAPSGLDVTSGSPGVCALATVTMTLAAPKVGLRHSIAVGELYLADISVPPAVYRRVGVTGPLPAFARAQIIRVDRSV